MSIEEKINFYRGSENDVLQRLFDAAKEFDLNYFANITADIPMIDPFLVSFFQGFQRPETVLEINYLMIIHYGKINISSRD